MRLDSARDLTRRAMPEEGSRSDEWVSRPLAEQEYTKAHQYAPRTVKPVIDLEVVYRGNEVVLQNPLR